MAGYVPYNGIVCAGCVVASTTVSQLFFNWLNQSHNAAINYCNRNAATETKTEDIVKSYSAAITAALGVSLGLSIIIQKRFPKNAAQLMTGIAFFSSAAASSSNCYIMRSPELASGWPLTDSNGAVVANGEKSKQAAKVGIMETVLSRVYLTASVFIMPALVANIPIIAALPATMSGPITGFVTIISFGIGLPAALAASPQYGVIEVKDLEPAFQGLKDKNGEPIVTLCYNRGL